MRLKATEHDLRRLKWINHVPVLILSGKRVTDEWVKHAAAMPGMEELHLYQAQISDERAGAADRSTPGSSSWGCITRPWAMPCWSRWPSSLYWAS